MWTASPASWCGTSRHDGRGVRLAEGMAPVPAPGCGLLASCDRRRGLVGRVFDKGDEGAFRFAGFAPNDDRRYVRLWPRAAVPGVRQPLAVPHRGTHHSLFWTPQDV